MTTSMCSMSLIHFIVRKLSILRVAVCICVQPFSLCGDHSRHLKHANLLHVDTKSFVNFLSLGSGSVSAQGRLDVQDVQASGYTVYRVWDLGLGLRLRRS